MSPFVRKSVTEVVEEIVDITPMLNLADRQYANGYAVQVEAALARSRANTMLQHFHGASRRERLG